MNNVVSQDIDKLVRAVKRRKWYYTIFMTLAAIVVFCTVYALILPAITLTQESTSTVNPVLSHYMYQDPSSSKTYRAYLEYSLPDSIKPETFGIPRQSVLYVYAYAGETICLGSDIVNSRIDVNENVQNAPTGADIVVTAPDGTTKYTFDNDQDTMLGVIWTKAQEKNGANFDGTNTNGYTPHMLEAKQTGLYEVRFHSYSGDAMTCCGDGITHLRKTSNTDEKGSSYNAGSNGEPIIRWYYQENWCNSGASVGSFDITVLSSEGEIQHGRAYADYLAMNMGNNVGKTSQNKYSLNSKFYIVTSDGYIYLSKMQLDPFGFIFFSNSRGVVDLDTGYSAYHSIKANGQANNTAQMIMTGVPYAVYTPNHEATEFDKTYQIFFEEPDPALQGILYQRAFAPSEAQNIEFVGSKEANITYVGNGGYFKFDVENASSATITISFAAYNEEHHLTGDDAFDDVTINANVTSGTNYIYWDGNDKDGKEVPAGWYRNGNIEVEIKTHAGEIHFPLLDVENGTDITIERINDIYSYNNGVLENVSSIYEDSKYLVYYNNTRLTDNKNFLSYNPNHPTQPEEYSHIADDLDYSDGVTSNDHTLLNFYKNRGDFSIIDIWTYAIAKSKADIHTDLIVEDLDGYYTVNLNGLVFFDTDESTLYDIQDGDFPLKDVKVTLDYYYCGTRWNVVTDPDDPDVILRLEPAYHISEDSTGFDEDNNPIPPEIEYYYHHFVVERGFDEESQTYKYYLYKYPDGDTLHTKEPKPYILNNKHVTVDIDVNEETVETDDGTQETILKYQVWVPVHKETTTDAIGKYYFQGVLVNEELCDVPDDHPEYGNIVISVHNPNKDLYEITTVNTHTGDFENLYGTDSDHHSQVITLQQLYEKIQAERDAVQDEDDKPQNFSYTVADVGYYYETYDSPLTIVKHWGTIEDSNNIEKIQFIIEGYSDEIPQSEWIYVSLDLSYYRWYDTLTNLPAYVEVNDTKYQLSYRVISEEFVRYEDPNYYRYKYTYYWDAQPDAYGEYTRIQTDANGDPLQAGDPPAISRQEFPFETYITPLENTTTGDRIEVENWQNDTSQIKLIKYGANDEVTTLQYATFQLQKLNTANGKYEDVLTDLGKYTVTTDKNGVAIFRGLTEGDYRIIETVAPEYYGLLRDYVYFTVEKNQTTETEEANSAEGVDGSYETTYSVSVYDELQENPVSTIIKVDQYGNRIEPTKKSSGDESSGAESSTPGLSGAEFTIYKAYKSSTEQEGDDPTYVYNLETDKPLQMNGEDVKFTIGDNGETMLMIDTADGQRSMYISELQALLGDTDRFVLVETNVPEGYRAVDNAHLRIVGEGLTSYIICDNPYESGVWSEPVVTVYAPENLYIAKNTTIPTSFGGLSYINTTTGEIAFTDYTDNGGVNARGTLFGVVVKRNQAEPGTEMINDLTFADWTPVYGDPVNGYHTVNNTGEDSDTLLERVLKLMAVDEKNYGKYVYPFAVGEGKTLFTKVENLPGRPDRYLTYMLQAGETKCKWRETGEETGYYSDPQYAVLYFYSTASTLEGVSEENTVRVTSHGLRNKAKEFTMHFATNVLIPDINNALYVQKSDVDNNLINNAVFGVYQAVADASGKGYYVGVDSGKNTVYIELSEDNEMTANVYTGALVNGVLTDIQPVAQNKSFSFNTDGCSEISAGLTSDEIISSKGLVENTDGYTDKTGVIYIKGGYKIYPSQNSLGELNLAFTHGVCNIISEEGTTHFHYLTEGKYFVREIYAPGGFKLNNTNIEVFVGEKGVYANAGTVDDNVMVGNGPGYIISTLNQFASVGDIRETLSYIVAALKLDTDQSEIDGFADMSKMNNTNDWQYVKLDDTSIEAATKYIFDGLDGVENIGDLVSSDISLATVLYLIYNGYANEFQENYDMPLFDYTVNTDVEGAINSLLYWTKSGWSDLAIFQHKTAADQSDASNPEVTYTDISLDENGNANDISNLFSSSTFIRVADENEIDIELQKISSLDNSKRLKGASFVLYKVVDETDAETGEVTHTNYYYSVDEETGETLWQPLGEGESEIRYALTTKSKGVILYRDFENGEYHLKEIIAPTGYLPPIYDYTITVSGGVVSAYKNDGSNTPIPVISPGEDENNGKYAVVITNNIGYELPATGGHGTLMYTLGGLSLMAAAVVVYGLFCRRRRERRNG